MSMDVIVWAACAVSLPADLPEHNKWSNYGGTDWAYETDTWQVVIDKEVGIKAPDQVLSKNTTHTIPTSVVLEPIGASNEAYAFWGKVAETVAKSCGGATLEGPMGFVQLDENGNEIK